MVLLFRSFSKSSSTSSSSSPITTPSSSSRLKEEITYVDLSQSLDNWKIPKFSPKEIYKSSKWPLTSDYVIRTVEETVKLDTDSKEIRLLTSNTVNQFRQK